MTKTRATMLGPVFAWAALLCFANPAQADNVPCAKPTEIHGFRTCADIAKAEQEGRVTVYVSDPEAGDAKLMAEFHRLFPKIDAQYVRASTAALYAKILTEVRANAIQADVLQLGDIGLGIDFQKREGYDIYVSPEVSAYKPEYRSAPAGNFVWGSVIMAGIAYNPNTVPDAEAPKNWTELLDPKWAGQVTFKSANSGMQHLAWYELRRVYGPSYWQSFEKTKATAFDSMVQQYERITNGKDKIAGAAQYSGYLVEKAKGAPITFIFPKDGLPGGPEVWGVVKGSPHPNAGRLFYDWFLSKPGQTLMVNAFGLHSVREDVPPPPGGVALKDMKLLLPTDWHDFLATKGEFNKQWKVITTR